MDSRTVAHVLEQIADLLELHGENRFKTNAYRNAARAVLQLDSDDVGALYRSGALAELKGLGPATLSVIGELAETGESRYYEQLRRDTPDGLLEMLRIPGLGTSKIHQVHEGLGVTTVDELEEAARDGRLAALPRFGAKTAEKILRGIAYQRENSAFVLYPQALDEARRLLASISQHPDVERAVVAGSVRRRREVVRDIDIVAACRTDPAAVAASFAKAPGVREAVGTGKRSISLRYVDGTQLDLHCVSPAQFGMALWRATGSTEHEREIRARAEMLGIALGEDDVREGGTDLSIPDEAALYDALGLAYIEPELREGLGEVAAAAEHTLPRLVSMHDIRGVLHCHSQYSDGKATIAEMAAAAEAHGWSYLGISDHSQFAAYAGGLSRERVLAQHEEIDRVNHEMENIRLLKGVEADILPDGRIDYEPELLDRFDYVIASVHSQFGMEPRQMTERVLRALDDPHVTVLGHPTGRLLLAREPYAIDMDAVLEKAASVGVAVELNADPRRLDLDWRRCRQATSLGITIEIGPDAHSPRGLDNMEFGVGIARKGWLEAGDVLNTQDADEIIERAARRRGGHTTRKRGRRQGK
ncbi:MAG TPA: DNA polymerase/3'-5' exonuclease PolX [Gemmatimonadaceae bacterium]|nr:DNA polymerase/3'-5' exonuclease PolX [Gemmatimonadaceae bacterium]